MFESEEAKDFIQWFLSQDEANKKKVIEDPLSFKDHNIMEKYVHMVKVVHNAMGKYTKEDIVKELESRGFGEFATSLIESILKRSD